MWYVFRVEMDLETKMELLKWTNSYWDMLPPELKEIIFEYKESQELIEWRESALSRALCKQIGLYEKLRQKWQVGHIQCKPMKCNCSAICECMRVYGWYCDVRGGIHKMYLGMSLQHAIKSCDLRRVRLVDMEYVVIGYVRARIRRAPIQ